MNHRELATALASLTPEQVQTIVIASESMRATEASLATLSGKTKTRKKRGPNKAKVDAPTVAPVAAPAPAKRRGRPPAPKPDPKPLSSALDRLKSVKAGGIKARRSSPATDEE